MRSTPRRINARGLCRGNDACMLGEIDALGRFLWRHALFAQRLGLLIEIAPVRLQVADVILALEHAAVAGQHRVEIQRHDRFERRRPFRDKCIAGIRQGARDHVAGRHHALLRQEHDDVAVGMGAAQEPNLNFTAAAMQRHVARQRGIRRRRLELGLLVGVLLMDGELALVNRPFLRVRRFRDLSLQQREPVGDRSRAVHEVGALLERSRPVEAAPRCVVTDDRDVRPEHLIAERVIVVVVRVDHILHRLGGQRFHVGEESGGRRSGNARVDEHHVVVIYDDDGVAADGDRACRGRVIARLLRPSRICALAENRAPAAWPAVRRRAAPARARRK